MPGINNDSNSQTPPSYPANNDQRADLAHNEKSGITSQPSSTTPGLSGGDVESRGLYQRGVGATTKDQFGIPSLHNLQDKYAGLAQKQQPLFAGMAFIHANPFATPGMVMYQPGVNNGPNIAVAPGGVNLPPPLQTQYHQLQRDFTAHQPAMLNFVCQRMSYVQQELQLLTQELAALAAQAQVPPAQYVQLLPPPPQPLQLAPLPIAPFIHHYAQPCPACQQLWLPPQWQFVPGQPVIQGFPPMSQLMLPEAPPPLPLPPEPGFYYQPPLLHNPFNPYPHWEDIVAKYRNEPDGRFYGYMQQPNVFLPQINITVPNNQNQPVPPVDHQDANEIRERLKRIEQKLDRKPSDSDEGYDTGNDDDPGLIETEKPFAGSEIGEPPHADPTVLKGRDEPSTDFVKHLQGQITDLKKEKASLNDNINQLQTSLEKATEASKEGAFNKGQLAVLSQALDKLQQENERLQAKENELQKELASLNKSLGQAEEGQKLSQKQLDDLRAEKEKLSEEAKKGAEYSGRLSGLEDSLNNLHKLNEQLKSEKAEQAEELIAERRKSEEYVGHIANLREKVAAAETEKNISREQLEALKDELETLKQQQPKGLVRLEQLFDLEKQIETLQEREDGQKEAIRILEKSLKDKQANLDVANSHIKLLIERIGQSEPGELDRLKEQIAKATEAQQLATEQINQAKLELDQLRDAKEAEIAHLRQQAETDKETTAKEITALNQRIIDLDNQLEIAKRDKTGKEGELLQQSSAMETERARLQEDITEKTSEIDRLNKDMQALQEEAQRDKQAVLDKALEEKGQLDTEINALKQRLSEADEENTTAKEQLQIQLTAATEAQQLATEQINQAKLELDQLRDAKEAEIAHLRQQAETDKETTAKEITALNQRIIDLDNQLEIAKRDKTGKEGELLQQSSAMETERARLQEDITEKTSEIDRLNKDMQALQEEAQRDKQAVLDKALEEKGQLDTEINALKQRLSEADEENTTAKEQLQIQLTAATEAQQLATEQINQAKLELDQLRDAKEAEIAHLRQQAETDKETTAKEITALNQRIIDLDNQLEIAKRDKTGKEGELLQQSSAMETERARLQEDITEKTSEIDRLNKDMQALQEEAQRDKQAVLDKALEEKGQLDTEINALKQRLSEADEENTTAKEQLQIQLTAATEAQQLATEQINQAKLELDQLRDAKEAEIAHLRQQAETDKETTAKEITALNQRIIDLDNQLEIAKRDKTGKEGELLQQSSAMETERARLQEDITEKTSEIDRLNKDMQALQEEAQRDKQAVLDKALEEKGQLDTEINALKQRLSEADEENTTAKEQLQIQLTAATEAQQLATEQINQAKLELDQLRDAKEAEIAHLRQQAETDKETTAKEITALNQRIIDLDNQLEIAKRDKTGKEGELLQQSSAMETERARLQEDITEKTSEIDRLNKDMQALQEEAQRDKQAVLDKALEEKGQLDTEINALKQRLSEADEENTTAKEQLQIQLTAATEAQQLATEQINQAKLELDQLRDAKEAEIAHLRQQAETDKETTAKEITALNQRIIDLDNQLEIAKRDKTGKEGELLQQSSAMETERARLQEDITEKTSEIDRLNKDMQALQEEAQRDKQAVLDKALEEKGQLDTEINALKQRLSEADEENTTAKEQLQIQLTAATEAQQLATEILTQKSRELKELHEKHSEAEQTVRAKDKALSEEKTKREQKERELKTRLIEIDTAQKKLKEAKDTIVEQSAREDQRKTENERLNADISKIQDKNNLLEKTKERLEAELTALQRDKAAANPLRVHQNTSTLGALVDFKPLSKENLTAEQSAAWTAIESAQYIENKARQQMEDIKKSPRTITAISELSEWDIDHLSDQEMAMFAYIEELDKLKKNLKSKEGCDEDLINLFTSQIDEHITAVGANHKELSDAIDHVKDHIASFDERDNVTQAKDSVLAGKGIGDFLGLIFRPILATRTPGIDPSATDYAQGYKALEAARQLMEQLVTAANDSSGSSEAVYLRKQRAKTAIKELSALNDDRLLPGYQDQLSGYATVALAAIDEKKPTSEALQSNAHEALKEHPDLQKVLKKACETVDENERKKAKAMLSDEKVLSDVAWMVQRLQGSMQGIKKNQSALYPTTDAEKALKTSFDRMLITTCLKHGIPEKPDPRAIVLELSELVFDDTSPLLNIVSARYSKTLKGKNRQQKLLQHYTTLMEQLPSKAPATESAHAQELALFRQKEAGLYNIPTTTPKEGVIRAGIQNDHTLLGTVLRTLPSDKKEYKEIETTGDITIKAGDLVLQQHRDANGKVGALSVDLAGSKEECTPELYLLYPDYQSPFKATSPNGELHRDSLPLSNRRTMGKVGELLMTTDESRNAKPFYFQVVSDYEPGSVDSEPYLRCEPIGEGDLSQEVIEGCAIAWCACIAKGQNKQAQKLIEQAFRACPQNGKNNLDYLKQRLTSTADHLWGQNRAWFNQTDHASALAAIKNIESPKTASVSTSRAGNLPGMSAELPDSLLILKNRQQNKQRKPVPATETAGLAQLPASLDDHHDTYADVMKSMLKGHPQLNAMITRRTKERDAFKKEVFPTLCTFPGVEIPVEGANAEAIAKACQASHKQIQLLTEEFQGYVEDLSKLSISALQKMPADQRPCNIEQAKKWLSTGNTDPDFACAMMAFLTVESAQNTLNRIISDFDILLNDMKRLYVNSPNNDKTAIKAINLRAFDLASRYETMQAQVLELGAMHLSPEDASILLFQSALGFQLRDNQKGLVKTVSENISKMAQGLSGTSNRMVIDRGTGSGKTELSKMFELQACRNNMGAIYCAPKQNVGAFNVEMQRFARKQGFEFHPISIEKIIAGRSQQQGAWWKDLSELDKILQQLKGESLTGSTLVKVPASLSTADLCVIRKLHKSLAGQADYKEHYKRLEQMVAVLTSTGGKEASKSLLIHDEYDSYDELDDNYLQQLLPDFPLGPLTHSEAARLLLENDFGAQNLIAMSATEKTDLLTLQYCNAESLKDLTASTPFYQNDPTSGKCRTYRYIASSAMRVEESSTNDLSDTVKNALETYGPKTGMIFCQPDFPGGSEALAQEGIKAFEALGEKNQPVNGYLYFKEGQLFRYTPNHDRYGKQPDGSLGQALTEADEAEIRMKGGEGFGRFMAEQRAVTMPQNPDTVFIFKGLCGMSTAGKVQTTGRNRMLYNPFNPLYGHFVTNTSELKHWEKEGCDVTQRIAKEALEANSTLKRVRSEMPQDLSADFIKAMNENIVIYSRYKNQEGRKKCLSDLLDAKYSLWEKTFGPEKAGQLRQYHEAQSELSHLLRKVQFCITAELDFKQEAAETTSIAAQRAAEAERLFRKEKQTADEQCGEWLKPEVDALEAEVRKIINPNTPKAAGGMRKSTSDNTGGLAKMSRKPIGKSTQDIPRVGNEKQEPDFAKEYTEELAKLVVQEVGAEPQCFVSDTESASSVKGLFEQGDLAEPVKGRLEDLCQRIEAGKVLARSTNPDVKARLDSAIQEMKATSKTFLENIKKSTTGLEAFINRIITRDKSLTLEQSAAKDNLKSLIDIQARITALQNDAELIDFQKKTTKIIKDLLDEIGKMKIKFTGLIGTNEDIKELCGIIGKIVSIQADKEGGLYYKTIDGDIHVLFRHLHETLYKGDGPALFSIFHKGRTYPDHFLELKFNFNHNSGIKSTEDIAEIVFKSIVNQNRAQQVNEHTEAEKVCREKEEKDKRIREQALQYLRGPIQLALAKSIEEQKKTHMKQAGGIDKYLQQQATAQIAVTAN